MIRNMKLILILLMVLLFAVATSYALPPTTPKGDAIDVIDVMSPIDDGPKGGDEHGWGGEQRVGPNDNDQHTDIPYGWFNEMWWRIQKFLYNRII